MALFGLDASHADAENGMIKGDMRVCMQIHKAGYFVPRNWTWGMSIRDTANEVRA